MSAIGTKNFIQAVTLLLATILAASAGASAKDTTTNAPGQRTKPERIIATDYAGIQEAIDAARRLDVYHIYIPSGVYYIDKTLNLTGFTWSPITREIASGKEFIPRNNTITFEGAGRSTVLIARTDNTPAIDLSGCHSNMILRNFVLQTPFVKKPDGSGYWSETSSVGIFMARVLGVAGKGAASSGVHYFENVNVCGAYRVAAILSWDSEVNRFVNCRFSNCGQGDGFVFTDYPREGVKSPYVKNLPSCNTELRFYGSTFQALGKNSAALRISGASDVSIHGGYVSTGPEAFVGVYLDGTNHVKNVSLRDIRMECKGKHCLYAVGAVSDILIEGGQWISQQGEPIVHEDKARRKGGAHRYVFSRRSTGRASNWAIRNLRPSRNFADDPGLKLREGRFCAMRFESLLDSVIEQISFQSQYLVTDEKGKRSTVVATDIPLVEVTGFSRRNVFRVPSRESVVLGGDAKNNKIVAAADGTGEKVPSLWLGGQSSWHADKKSPTAPRYYDGVTRTYIKPDQGVSLVNLGVMDVLKIKSPKRGDIAIHDGSRLKDGKPCPVFFDGTKWVYFATISKRLLPK